MIDSSERIMPDVMQLSSLHLCFLLEFGSDDLM
jgi:hypothetical protein